MYLKDGIITENHYQQSISQSVIMKMIIVKDAGGSGHTMELWAGVSQ